MSIDSGFIQPKCCDDPAIQKMDFVKVLGPDIHIIRGRVCKPIITNRMCMRRGCFTHWYGPEGDVKQYTQKEWEAWINTP